MSSPATRELQPLEAQEYAAALTLLQHTSKHFDQVTHYFKQILLPRLQVRGSFLDIGAGSGILTSRLAPYFATTTVVEPNPAVEVPLLRRGYHLYPNTFLTAQMDPQQKYDFILISHVFYHLERQPIADNLHRAYDLLAPEGFLLVIMMAPHGQSHELHSEINPQYTHSAAIEEALKDLQLPYEKHSELNSFDAPDATQLGHLLRFFALDDCFTPSTFQQLSPEAKATLATTIEQQVERCRHDRHYRLEQAEDYFVIRKAQ